MASFDLGTVQQLTLATARYFKVLADPTRLAILQLLVESDRSVGELIAALGAPQSRVSNHLACLRWCGLVEAERAGRRVVYRLVDQRLNDLVAHASELAAEHCDHLSSCGRLGPAWV